MSYRHINDENQIKLVASGGNWQVYSVNSFNQFPDYTITFNKYIVEEGFKTKQVAKEQMESLRVQYGNNPPYMVDIFKEEEVIKKEEAKEYYEAVKTEEEIQKAAGYSTKLLFKGRMIWVTAEQEVDLFDRGLIPTMSEEAYALSKLQRGYSLWDENKVSDVKDENIEYARDLGISEERIDIALEESERREVENVLSHPENYDEFTQGTVGDGIKKEREGMNTLIIAIIIIIIIIIAYLKMG